METSGSPAYARALVQRLSSSSSNQQAEAAAKLAALGRHAVAAEAAVGAGAIPALLQLLTRSSSTVSSQAVCALSSLCSFNSARLRQLVQAGGVEALLPLLSGAPDVSKTAAFILAGMAEALPEAKQQLGAAILEPLLSLLRTTGSDPTRATALIAMNNL